MSSSIGLRLAAASSSRRASAAVSASQWSRLPQRRCVHKRRPLPYPIEQGLGNFLPPNALKTVAVDFQEGLLDRLTDEVKGTEWENASVADTVVGTAKHREHVQAFNFASQALNNSFFLSQLKPPTPGSPNEPRDPLAGVIGNNFKSLDELKMTVSATAMGMASSGWVWLVTDKETSTLAVVPTFGAGTLLVRSRRQVRPNDTEFLVSASLPPPPIPPTSPASGMPSPLSPFSPRTPSRALSMSAPRANPDSVLDRVPASAYGQVQHSDPAASRKQDLDFKTIGNEIYPLFCVSVHEHAWMSAGLGVWGKEAYMREFWSVLDWAKVTETFKTFQAANHKRRT
ncbi:hypothetical protein PLICRDRAFT_694070 [Plicaturopsis crispa FD-325 SS-3]|nr:hypothetical protein PLICRDRAFT_694070 [Plicaturopsis crispa FD-325 SS-3]